MRRRSPSLLLVAAFALLARPARAHSVWDSLTVGTTQSSPGNPSSTYVANKLAGEWDPKDWLSLRLDFGWTYDVPAPAPASAQFGTSARNVFLGNLGVDFMPNDHFTLSLDVFGSPRSRGVEDQQVPITVTAGGRTTTSTVDSQVQQITWSAGGILGFTWDQDSDGKFNTAIDLTAGFSWFETDQQTLQVVDRQGATVTAMQLQQECAARPRSVACGLARTLAPLASSAGQVRLAAAVTETFLDNTDVGVGGAYYLYTADPTQAINKGTALIRGTIDSALALAPWWWNARLDVAHRVRGFSLSGYFQGGKYLKDAGYDYNLSGGLRLAYKHKWEKVSLKVTVAGTVQDDVDSTGAPFLSGTVSLGARVRF